MVIYSGCADPLTLLHVHLLHLCLMGHQSLCYMSVIFQHLPWLCCNKRIRGMTIKQHVHFIPTRNIVKLFGTQTFC